MTKTCKSTAEFSSHPRTHHAVMEVDDLFTNSRTNFFYLIARPQEYDNDGSDQADGEEKRDDADTAACISFVDEVILPRQKKLPKLFAQRLCRMAVTLASITLAVTLTIAIMSFLTWHTSDSSGAFGFAFDSFFTALSSFMIIWRFCSSQSSGTENARRETISTTVIASCMVVSAGVIFLRAYQSLRDGEKPMQLVFILVLSVVSCVAYSLLFMAKYKVAVRMGSAALMTDAIDALSGGILAFSLVISSVIIKYSIDVWYLDSSIAMAIAVFSGCYGMAVLIRLISIYRDRENAAILGYFLTDYF